MLLREFFYFDETMEDKEDVSYDIGDDASIVKADDTRVTRLRLKDISKIRKASEFHDQQKQLELTKIRDQYKAPAEAGGI
jgi:hypothetical protein